LINITFSTEFDLGFWPGPLAGRDAAAGETWVGQNGLLTILETALGLRYPAEPDALRAAGLVPALRRQKGFWSASARVDPLGTARRLLSWRDRLALYGWQGQDVTEMLGSLAKVTVDVAPGFPDRLGAVRDALTQRSAEIGRLNLCEPLEGIPLGWSQVLEALAGQGAEIQVNEPTPARATGDLKGARADGFKPRADGSLQLVRPVGTMGAAREVAAWLSARDSLDGVVVIGGDALLDRELARFGLPTLGAAGQVHDQTLLQVAPLVLEMGWSPPDPQRALELLTLPVGPVPRGLAWRLTRALQEWPAVGSERWQEELGQGLNGIEDAGYRATVQARLEAIFRPRARQSRYPGNEIGARLELVDAWARGRMGMAGEDEDHWLPVLRQVQNLARLVDLAGMDLFSPAQLRRAVQDATVAAGLPPLAPAQAGLHHVGLPGGLAGAARVVIWWNFARGSEPGPHKLPLTVAERAKLRLEGVEVPEPGEEGIRLASLWQRPLMMASEQLLLICPARDEDGEELNPHPLWDEVMARAADGGKMAALEVERPLGAPRRTPRASAALPGPVEVWQAPEGVLLRRDREWPTSLERLVSCPFRWVVQDLARVRAGATAALQDGFMLEGQLMHEVLARLLTKIPKDPKQAEKRALDIFDHDGPLLAAPIFLPGAEDTKGRLRRMVGRAAKNLARLLAAAKLKPTAMEQEFSAQVGGLGLVLAGRPDLVAGHVVIDFKRGGANRWRERLSAGTATQMACYAWLCRDKRKKALPPAGVFIIREALLLTANSRAFPDAEVMAGPALDDTWRELLAATQRRWAEMDGGEVIAIGAGADPPTRSELTEDGMVLAASCEYCDCATLCGLGWVQ